MERKVQNRRRGELVPVFWVNLLREHKEDLGDKYMVIP